MPLLTNPNSLDPIVVSATCSCGKKILLILDNPKGSYYASCPYCMAKTYQTSCLKCGDGYSYILDENSLIKGTDCWKCNLGHHNKQLPDAPLIRAYRGIDELPEDMRILYEKSQKATKLFYWIVGGFLAILAILMTLF